MTKPAPAPPPIEIAPAPSVPAPVAPVAKPPMEPGNDGPDLSGLEPFEDPGTPASGPPAGWEELRADPDIQFREYEVPPPPPPDPPEPNWLSEALASFFRFLADLLGPVGQMLAGAWPVLSWVLLALLVAFVAYVAWRTLGPLAQRKAGPRKATSEPEWQPDAEESEALLGDADALAAQGRYDEATHLLLQRSVRQIATARPDWVDPSSTARELAALPALSDRARRAFAVISELVERSLFALRALGREDWEAARAAYADFALARIEQSPAEGSPA